MTDLRDRLQATLGNSYSIDRELSGGGMSRVFVARDQSLGRPIVVKVLPPELSSGVNSDRFRREIQLAAVLQHPHIVPILSAGDADGVLFYTMPLVDGESLRARLERGGELPVREAVRLLRDVADALAYAHRHGVIHRDIKPDNVLCSDAHALVTDFGVAKALSNSAGQSITATGLVVGTPGYVAPEQAAGDPMLDHRADIYAFGVLAYELLAGHAPFRGTSAQAVLAAHIAQTPEPLQRVRPTVPFALAALVMRCLEKRPADRPQSAGEIVSELGSVSSGTTTAAPVMRIARRSWLLLGAAAIVVIGIGVAALALRARSAAEGTDDHLVTVTPFRVSGDSSLAYLREGMVDLLTAKFTGEGGLRATHPRATLAAWRRYGGENGTEDVGPRVAQSLGAGGLVVGQLVGSAARIVITASLVGSADGTVRARGEAHGPADSLDALVSKVAAELLAGSAGVSEERLASATHTSLPALRAYVDGMHAYRAGRSVDAVKMFQRALENDSTFALAALGLHDAGELGGGDYTTAVATRIAWQNRDRLGARDRARMTAIAGSNYPALRTHANELYDYERVASGFADDPDAWYFLGDRLLNQGQLIGAPEAIQRAKTAFERALALDSSFAVPIARLAYLAGWQGDTVAEERFEKLYLARVPGGEASQWMRWRLATLSGDSAAAQEIEASLGEHDILVLAPFFWVPITSAIAADIPERAVSLAINRASETSHRYYMLDFRARLETVRGQPHASAQTRAEIEKMVGKRSVSLRPIVMDAIFGGGESAAAATAASELARMGALPTPDSELVMRKISALCTLEQWRLANGDTSSTARTVAILRSMSGDVAHFCAVVLHAQRAALAGQDAAPALARLDSLLDTGTTLDIDAVGYYLALGMAYANIVAARLHERAGDYNGALRAIRRRQTDFYYPQYLSTFLREEGRLAALAGDRGGAISAYRHYLNLRRNPEPVFVPQRDSVRAELAQLTAQR